MISFEKKRLKNLLLVLLVLMMLILILLILRKKEYVEVFSNIIDGEKTENNIINGISINNVNLIYDFNNNTYYFPINLDNEEEQIELEIKINSSENIKSKIGNKEFSKQIKLTENIDYNKTLELVVESFLYKSNCKIKFTNMPIITMNFNEEEIGTEYIYSEFSITDPNYIQNNSEYQFITSSKVRYRGSSTINFDKKGFRIKIEDNIDFGLLGMNKSKTWILDALATDPSCIRTKISSDLWRNINEDLDKDKYPELNTEYVEVFINGSYKGLYILKEVIDEELLQLHKNTGVLIKGVNWNQLDFINYNNVDSDIYGPFELKFPKVKNKYSESWTNILGKLEDYYSGNVNYNVINNTFYNENLANHKIFLLILQAMDNYEFKNIYYSIKNDDNDTRVLITPWDLDLTFGLLWDDNQSRFTQQYNRVEEIAEPFGINQDGKFKQDLKERWKYLSQSELAKEKVYSMIDEQYDYLTKAEALERENNKYYNIDIDKEIKDLKEWYNKRFEVIDKYIKSLQ